MKEIFKEELLFIPKMTTKTIILSMKPYKEALIEFAEVYGKLKRGEKVKPKYELSFGNVEGLRDFLTGKRLDLLREIKREHPNSVYELGKITNRDLKSINADLKILEEHGLVKLEKTKEGRSRIVPKVNFDRIKIEINL